MRGPPKGPLPQSLSDTFKWEGSVMNRFGILVAFFVFLGLLTAFSPIQASGSDDLRITVDQLHKMLGNPDLVVIDVRDPLSWKKSDLKIAGAVREDYKKVDEWAKDLSKEKTFVLYCA
jgi:hypothetical protein